MKNGFLQEFKDRGYLNQCTDIQRLDSLLNTKSTRSYIGFDCTANSLHVGSLLQIMILRLLQKYGHQPIVLLGGGTTLIGDPSGKDKTRSILNNLNIKKNAESIKKLLKSLLSNKNKKTEPIFVNNLNWLGKLNYIDFLRSIGQHFTINKMLTFDSVKLRLDREQSLSYMEFNYMILQAYDFFQLNKKYNCMLQLGGSDQWGNIINGVELIRKILKKDSFGLTTPLITMSNGAKMGKTEKGAIWLDKKMFSPYNYWQFWRNIPDNDVKKFLFYFTDISIENINNLVQNEKNINKLKIILANEATKILHGEAESKKSEQISNKIFLKGELVEGLPIIKIKKKELVRNLNIIEILYKYNVVTSKSEARRLIKNRGIKIDDNLVLSDKENLKLDKDKKKFKISYGKKKHYMVKII